MMPNAGSMQARHANAVAAAGGHDIADLLENPSSSSHSPSLNSTPLDHQGASISKNKRKQPPPAKSPKPSFSARLNLLFPSYSLEATYGQEKRNNAVSDPHATTSPDLSLLGRSYSNDPAIPFRSTDTAVTYKHSSQHPSNSHSTAASPDPNTVSRPFRGRAPAGTRLDTNTTNTSPPNTAVAPSSTSQSHTTPNTPDMPQLRSFASFSSLRSLQGGDNSRNPQSSSIQPGPKKKRRLFPFQIARSHNTDESRPPSRADTLNAFGAYSSRDASPSDAPDGPPNNISPAAAKLLGISYPPPPPRRHALERQYRKDSHASEGSQDTARAPRHITPVPSPNLHNDSGYFAVSRKQSQNELQAALAYFPDSTSPAPAKMPGAEVEDHSEGSDTTTVHAAPSSIIASSVVSRSGSPQHIIKRTSSTPDLLNFRSPLRTTASSTELRLAAAATIQANASAPRPEHPLEIEARSKPGAFMTAPSPALPQDVVLPHNSFLSGASDSEEEEGYSDKHSSGYHSGYSYASSQTSYGVASPLDADIPDMPDMSNLDFERFASTVQARRKIEIPNRSSSSTNHNHQTSTSSVPNHKYHTSTSSLASARTGRSNSFGPQPMPNLRGSEPPLPTDTFIPSPPSTSNGLMGTTTSQLTAITEDPSRSAGKPTPKSPKQKSSPSHKRDASDHLSRPRFQEKYEVMPLPMPPVAAVKPKHVPASSLSLALNKMTESIISAEGAEKVILRVFEALESFEDIAVCARLNKGFYRVYKKHELRLLKNALRNFSPAQWEHREASPKEIIAHHEHPGSEYTPLVYVQFHKRDSYVLASLKTMMLQRCQAHLRKETIEALSQHDPAISARVDDAFWRVWTFCTIFGSESGREDDLDAQVDWLRGGVEAHRPRTPHANPRSRRYKTELRNRPLPSFGQGNFGGLTIDELDDMTEIWNGLKVLLQGISRHGRLEQAREYGLFDGLDVVPANEGVEQQLLDEWVHWLATQGLSTITDLATYAAMPSPVVFATARAMDWTEWAPPPTSRASFLQLAITHAQKERNAVRAFSRFDGDAVEPVAERRRSRGLILSSILREGERGFALEEPIQPQSQAPSTLDDKGLGLWVQWMSITEGKSHDAFHDSSSSKAPSRSVGPSPAHPPPPRPNMAPRHRSSSNVLSLFPSLDRQPNGDSGVSITPAPQAPRSRRAGMQRVLEVSKE